MDSLFENGKALSFYDLMKGERAIRKHYEANANQMIGQVDSIGSLHKGDDARMKTDSAGYRKGDPVKAAFYRVDITTMQFRKSLVLRIWKSNRRCPSFNGQPNFFLI